MVALIMDNSELFLLIFAGLHTENHYALSSYTSPHLGQTAFCFGAWTEPEAHVSPHWPGSGSSRDDDR